LDTQSPGISPFASMGIGDILDKSIGIYRKNFKVLCGITAIAYIPYILFILAYLIFLFFGDNKHEVGIFIIAGLFFLCVPIWIIILNLSQGFIINIISHIISDRPFSLSETWKEFFKFEKIFNLLMTMFLYGFIMSLPIIPCVVLFICFPFIVTSSYKALLTVLFFIILIILVIVIMIFALVYNFLVPVIVLEKKAYFSAIKRAMTLIIKDPLKVISVTLLLSMLVQIIQGAFSVPFVFLSIFLMQYHKGLYLVIQMLPQLSAIILVPVLFVGNTLLYYDVRFRKEGYDLEVMADELFKKCSKDDSENV